MAGNGQKALHTNHAFAPFMKDIAAISLLTILVIAALFPMSFLDQLSVSNDNININISRHVFIHGEFRAGRIPFWNPLVLGGMPMESSYVPSNPYNPILLPAMLIRDPISSYRFLICFWMTLMSVFFYVFARTALRANIVASIAGAVIYALNGFTLSRIEHPTCLAVILWTPLVMTGTLNWLRHRRPFWIFFIALTTAMQFFGFHILYSAISFMAAFSTWLFWGAVRDEKSTKTDFRGLAGLVAGIVLGAIAGAIVIVPFLIHGASAQRAQWHFKTFVPGALGLRDIIAFFLPGAFGSYFNHTNWTEGAYWHEASGYIGLAATLLIFGIGRKHLGRKGRFFALIALFGVLISLGTSTPVGKLILNLPVLNAFNYPGRFLLLWTLGISAAATIALNGLLRSEIKTYKSYWLTAFATLSAAVILIAFPGMFITAGLAAIKLFLTSPSISALSGKILSGAGVHNLTFYQHKFTVEMFPPLRFAFIAALLSASGVAALLIMHNRFRRVIGYMWVALLFLSFLQTAPMLIDYHPAGILRKPPAYLSRISGELGGMRLMPAAKSTNEFVWPYTMEADTIHGVPISKGYLQFHPLNEVEFPKWDIDCRYFAAKFMTLPEREKLSHPNCSAGRLIAEFEPYPPGSNNKIHVYTVKSYLPIAYIAHDMIFATGAHQIRLLADSPGFDPEKTVILSGADGVSNPALTSIQYNETPGDDAKMHNIPEGKTDIVSMSRPRPDTVIVNSWSSKQGILVVLDTYLKGWTATIDGKNAPIIKAFGGFKGIPLPAGSHEVRLQYRPIAFFKSLPFSMVAWFAISLGMIFSLKKPAR